MNRSCLSWLTLLFIATMLTACSQTSSSVSGIHAAPPSNQDSLRQVSVPPRMQDESLEPLTGQAQVTANLPLSKVVKRVSLPQYLKNSNGVSATQPATWPTAQSKSKKQSQTLRKAERAYARGRAAWIDGKRMDGLNQMETAVRLAPDQPAILAALGRMWVQAGNQVRGEDYLKRAAADGYHDLPTLMLLGRFALKHRHWSQAAAIFFAAQHELKKQNLSDPAIAPLLHYDLGLSLRHAGYLLAAVKQYEAYLKAPRDFLRPTTFGEQLLYTDQQEGDVWQVIGDLSNQLNHPSDAIYAYHHASKLGVVAPASLLKARLFSQLRLNQLGMAQSLILRLLRESSNSHDALSMIGYLTDNGVPAAPFARRLETFYQAQNRPARLAIAIAHLLPQDKATAFLRDHLQAKPDDYDVFKALICDQLLPHPGRAEISDLQTAAAITAREIKADHTHAYEALKLLVTRAGDSHKLLSAISQLPAKQKQTAAMPVIRGKALSLTGELDLAIAAYRNALKIDTKLAVARVELATILIDRNQYDKALALLKPLEGTLDDRAVHLQVEALRLSGADDKAVKLLDRLIQAHGPQLDLVLQKAHFQILLHQTEQAAQTLQDAINAHPDNQKLYAELFNLYNSDAYQGDAVKGYESLMEQMLRNIPESRIAKLKLAWLHARRGEDEQAKELIDDLLKRNDADGQALFLLARIEDKNGHHDKAVKLFTHAIENHPKNKDVLTAAQAFYADAKDDDREFAVSRKLISLKPPGEKRDLAMAHLYLAAGKNKKGIALLRDILNGSAHPLADPEPAVNLLWRALVQDNKPVKAESAVQAAIKQFPKAHAKLTFELANLYQAIGKEQKSEATLQKLVKSNPDDARADNALGYTWADEGKNLKQAHDLIVRALKAKPTESAYLDSMGWVLYKMGRFKQAIEYFHKAVDQPAGEDPVIMDHYGDALCRAGDIAEAFKVWRKAYNIYQNISHGNGGSSNDLGQQLLAKIKASRRREAIKNIPYLPPIGAKK